MKAVIATLIGLGFATAAAAVKTTRSQSAATNEPTLSELRAATAKYKDVKVALAEGFIRDPANMCDAAEMMGKPKALGVMGIHYVRPDLLGITGPPNPRVNGTSTYTDFNKPAILIYEPQADESLQLVAVENLVFIKAWEAAGNTKPPTYQGVPYDKMADDPKTEIDEAHNFEPHYDRHVWIHRENPNGVYAQFNPNATCKYHRGGEHKH